MLSTTAKWIIADETIVTELPLDVRVLKKVISPDLRHVAYVADLGAT